MCVCGCLTVLYIISNSFAFWKQRSLSLFTLIKSQTDCLFVVGELHSFFLSCQGFIFHQTVGQERGRRRRRRNVLADSVKNPFSLACCCSSGDGGGASDNGKGRLGADILPPHPSLITHSRIMALLFLLLLLRR